MEKAIILWDGNCFLAVMIPAVRLAFSSNWQIDGLPGICSKIICTERKTNQKRAFSLESLLLILCGEGATFTHNLQIISGILMNVFLLKCNLYENN